MIATRVVFALTLFLAAIVTPCLASSGPDRLFEFSYEVRAQDLPSSAAVDIYIPRPTDQPGQRILDSDLVASLPVNEGWEARYLNGYYHLHRPAGADAEVELNFSWTVSRSEVSTGMEQQLSVADRDKYLSANTLVPVGHPMLDPILEEIHEMRTDDSRAATARAIYDWVVDNVEYKKVGTGWGNGDTFWACNERYGNCTDFHALFISLARSEGIPARFEIGFPVPNDRPSGDIKGYHCWVQFFLAGQGWVPIDASEAAKNPDKREQYYGAQPADRIHFSTGRDLALSRQSEKTPLNYFIYPYVEVGGKPWNEKLDTRFHFREID
jgi:transglutaminase-like putative cysteine protease